MLGLNFNMGLLSFDLITLLITLTIIIYTYMKWSLHYWKRKNVPYLEPRLLLGNLEVPFRKTVSIGEDIANKCFEAKQKGWKYFGMYFFMRPIFMALDPELIKHIMTKDFNHFVDRGAYVNEKDEPISAHLFAIGGTKWRNLRMKFTPTFTSGKMRMMFQTLADCGILLEKFVDDTLAKNSKEPLDIKNILASFSTDIIGSCAFGLECNSFTQPDSPFRQFGTKILQRTKFGQLKIIIAQTYPNLAKKLHITIFPTDVTEFFTDVVKKTVEYREKNNVERKDFLQMLIEIKNNKEAATDGHQGDGKTLTIDEMVAQSFVFFVAGFETSSTTMTFALFELAVNPDIQDKVREEIHRVLKKHNNQINYDSLKELEYMEQVINETLRKYPPIPFVTRECVEDYTLPNSDIIIEKGTRVIIPIKGLHYDEEYYDNPEVFNPDRFTEENKRSRHHYTHLPFGEGPRICIGMRFGIMQTKVGLVSILRNHKVSVNEKTHVPLKMLVNSFIPNTEGGIWLNIQKA